MIAIAINSRKLVTPGEVILTPCLQFSPGELVSEGDS